MKTLSSGLYGDTIPFGTMFAQNAQERSQSAVVPWVFVFRECHGACGTVANRRKEPDSVKGIEED